LRLTQIVLDSIDVAQHAGEVGDGVLDRLPLLPDTRIVRVGGIGRQPIQPELSAARPRIASLVA
jgi:hypothetical protein